MKTETNREELLKILPGYENYPTFSDFLPAGEEESGHYVMRFARTLEDLDGIFQLRYEVFNLELNEGLDASHTTGRDQDQFDPGCHHLIIADKRTDEIIGTYRMQRREMAKAAHGFYSAGEFQLNMLPDEVLDQSVELGRACVALDHRNGRVLFLLWRGVIKYLQFNGKRYLFGCSSLTSQDPAEGKRMMNHLTRKGNVHEEHEVLPQPDYVCYDDSVVVEENASVKVPRLMRLYLTYGVKVCGPPAIDREFKTIDYLVLLDIENSNKQFRKLLLDE
ncbi:MAG: GNAT family N-acyltransferase [Verrucomicrobiota bacterium]